jgi:hypothetical protein
MLCALIKDNLVDSIVTVNSDDDYAALARQYSNVIDVTDANPAPAVGWAFVGNGLVPGPGQSAVLEKKITKLALRNRMTFTELCTLTAAAHSVVQVEALMGNLSVATFIDLNRADTIAGIQMLVSLNLLTQARVDQILNAPITDLERYKP